MAPMYLQPGNIPTSEPCNVSRHASSWAPSYYSAPGACDPRDRQSGRQSSVAHPMHQLMEEEHHDGRPLAMSADSRNRAPVQSNGELRLLRAEAKESKHALFDARKMAERAQDRADAATEAAERTRREQLVLIERLRQLETTAFGGPQQIESARVRAGLGPSRR
ncbi:unnamed protein product [Peronospora effusa]|nr:unnamed protein product [Peronospora effusa]